jgi:Flp pilus assembly secretin CpaC
MAIFAIASAMLFASCLSFSGQKKGISNAQTRNEIMREIAADSMMSNEMIQTMMTSENGRMVMQNHQKVTMENHYAMMNMVKTTPGIAQRMMAAMMETAKGDSMMMSGMITSMMENPQMMEMMQKRMGTNSMNGMGQMGGMNH